MEWATRDLETRAPTFAINILNLCTPSTDADQETERRENYEFHDAMPRSKANRRRTSYLFGWILTGTRSRSAIPSPGTSMIELYLRTCLLRNWSRTWVFHWRPRPL